VNNSGVRTVMVADDYDEVRGILKNWLEQHSFRVVEATSGKEAVEVAKREHPELILMDLAMPEIDGFGAAFLIKTQKELEDIPIIGISAFGELGIDVQLKIDPKAVGFTDYLPKPFAPQKLLELVEKYLPRRSASAGS
jgi:CheY-like chemotaxis protein